MNKNDEHLTIGVVGDADNFWRSVGSVQQRKQWFSQELEQTKKKKAG
jgi:hypothetical protein